MSKIVSRTFIVLMLALLSVASFADTFDNEIASVVLLQIKAVQKDLGITEQQRAVMNKYADAHRAKLDAYYTKLRAANEKPDEQTLLQYFYELKKNVLAQMTTAQVKRLREISLQVLDIFALADKVVGERVGLSASQESQVQTIVKAADEKASSVREDAVMRDTASLKNQNPKSKAERDALIKDFNNKAQAAANRVKPQLQQIKDSARKRVMSLLSASQRAKWEELLGAPFRS